MALGHVGARAWGCVVDTAFSKVWFWDADGHPRFPASSLCRLPVIHTDGNNFFLAPCRSGRGLRQPHNGGATLSCFHSALFWLQRSVHPTLLLPQHFSSLVSLYGQVSGLLNSCVLVSSHPYPSYLSWSCLVMGCACKSSIKSALCICVSMGWLLPFAGR